MHGVNNINKPYAISFQISVVLAVSSSEYNVVCNLYFSTQSRFQIQVSLRGIFGGQSGTKTGVSSIGGT